MMENYQRHPELLIRQAKKEEWQDAMALAWRTFLKYDAADYTPEGVDNFRDFLSNSILYRMFNVGSYEVFLAFEKSILAGMLSIRNINHISLFFVDEEHQGTGVGRALFFHVKEYIRTETGGDSITVDSSPMARGFYKKLGFYETGPAKTEKGIIYTPMNYRIR